MNFITACGAVGIDPEGIVSKDPTRPVDLDRLIKLFKVAFSAGKDSGMEAGRKEARLVAKAGADLKAVRKRKGV